MKLSFGFLIFIMIVTADITAENVSDINDVNEYIDEILDYLRQNEELVSRIDPVRVPDIKDPNFELRNGLIKGLSSLYRFGNSSVAVNDREEINVVADLAVKSVKISADYSVWAAFFWINGDTDIAVDHLAVRFNLTSKESIAHLNSLKVVNLGDYRVERISGLSFAFNWLLKLIANNMAQNARGLIIDALENHGADALRQVLKQFKLPLYYPQDKRFK